MFFLMGLNESFAQVRGQLLLTNPLPPINKVFALISQEKNQWNVVVNSGDLVLFNVKHDMRKVSQNRF